MTSENNRWRVVRHWHRFTVEDLADPEKQHTVYDTQDQAQADADCRNQADAQRRRPRPSQPVQPDLFSQQEAI